MSVCVRAWKQQEANSRRLLAPSAAVVHRISEENLSRNRLEASAESKYATDRAKSRSFGTFYPAEIKCSRKKKK